MGPQQPRPSWQRARPLIDAHLTREQATADFKARGQARPAHTRQNCDLQHIRDSSSCGNVTKRTAEFVTPSNGPLDTRLCVGGAAATATRSGPFLSFVMQRISGPHPRVSRRARPLPAQQLKATARAEPANGRCRARLRAATKSVLFFRDKILAIDANGTAEGVAVGENTSRVQICASGCRNYQTKTKLRRADVPKA